jgi:hypothetical protein
MDNLHSLNEIRRPMIQVETVAGIKKGGMKESSGGGEFMYDIFDTF